MPLLSSLLTPMVAMKNPALCESHPNICDDRHGTEETIISCQDGMWERKNKGKEEERERVIRECIRRIKGILRRAEEGK